MFSSYQAIPSPEKDKYSTKTLNLLQ